MKLLKFPLRFLAPKSVSEDVRRREFILTVFAVSIVLLLFISIGVSGVNDLFFSDPAQRAGDALSFPFLFGIFAFFACIWWLSRRGFIDTGSYLLIGALFSLATYLGYRWGMDMPAAILFYVITITMAGVLISTRFAFFTTLAISLVVGVVSYLHRIEMIEINRYWATQVWKTTDVVVAAILFLIVATVSWLSNREIERSLARARRSEAELKEERDTLEVRVEERTRELRTAEMEKIAQTYRFVEFGRLASGLFHDLMNPLTALSLNIDRIAQSDSNEKGVGTLAEDVERAKRTTMHMRELIDAMRSHLSREGVHAVFPLRDRIHDVVRVLEPYARMHHVVLSFAPVRDVNAYGDAARFVQIVSNLISNAIEAYLPRGHVARATERREVCIELDKKGTSAHVAVRDFGPGIAEEVQETLFEPFVTTKKSRGLGLGLSLTKQMVEQDFDGTIVAESRKGEGACFVVLFPLRNA